MKHILQFPKLILFFGSVVAAYVLFVVGAFHWIETHLDGASYPSMIFAGFFFSFGFTSPFATAYFFEIGHIVNPFIAAPIAAIGAMTADIGIFEFTRMSLRDEILKLRATGFLKRIRAAFHRTSVSDRLRMFGRWTLACMIIASPLPDEIGMTLIAGFTKIGGWRFSLLCFALNTVGVLMMLLLGRLSA